MYIDEISSLKLGGYFFLKTHPKSVAFYIKF